MPDDESSIFGNLPGLRDDDQETRERRARTRLYMRLRGQEEGPLPPSPWRRGVGGPSIGQGAPVVTGSTWSTADAAANSPPMTLSNGGLTVTPSGASINQSIRGTTSHITGKYYIEFKCMSSGNNNYAIIGIADSSFAPGNSYLGASGNGVAAGIQLSGANYGSTANFIFSSFVSPPMTPALNDIWALAIDFTAGYAWLGVNNNFGFVNGNPGTGANPFFQFIAPALGTAFFPGMTFNSVSGTWTLQPTAASQKYAPPSGFSPWG